GRGASGWWIDREAPSSRPSIVIEAAGEPTTPIGEMMAQSIASNLGRFQAGPITRLEIQPAGSKHSMTYRAKVKIVEGERQLMLGLTLDSGSGGRLWTTSIEGPSHGHTALQRDDG